MNMEIWEAKELIEGDLLEYPVDHGDLIYISSLCFEKELLEKIAEKLVKDVNTEFMCIVIEL